MKRNEIKLTQEQLKTRKMLCIITLFCFALLYSGLCFGLAPLAESFDADIAISDGVTQTVSYICTVTELAAISLFYAVMLFGIFDFGARYTLPLTYIFAGATLYKYIAHKIMAFVKEGALPRELFAHVADVLLYTALEALQMLIVFLIAYKISQGRSGGEQEIRILNFKSPAVRSAMWASLVVFISKFIGRPLNDLWNIILSGPPKSSETVIKMLVWYLFDAAYAAVYTVIAYIIIFSVLQALDKMVKKQNS